MVSKGENIPHIPLRMEGMSDAMVTRQVAEKTRPRLQPPAMYKVILLNDDATPMDFVVLILKSVFHKSQKEAVHVMLQTHHEGRGYCGSYTRDVAETKMIQVIECARANNYPLKCVIDKD